MAAKKPSKLATLKEAFEKSDADDDAGMAEDGPADKKADKKQFKSFAKKAAPAAPPAKKKGGY